MNTIRGQLIRKLLLGFGLLLSLGGVAVYVSTREALVEQFDTTLRAKANAVSSTTEEHNNRVESELAEQFVPEFDDDAPVEFFQLRRADETTVRRSKSLAEADLPAIYGTFRRPRYWNLVLPSGHRGRAIGYMFHPADTESENSTNAVELSVVFASDRQELDESLLTLAVALLGCGALLLGATVIVVPRVLRRELAPLDRLAEQASRITAESLSTRFPTDTVPGEIKPISSRLNDLLSRLEESFERERRFSADLAHELRTPIAELRSLTEVALKWPESRPRETDSDTLEIAIQMEGIVVRLLDLLRSERAQVVPQREAVRIGEMLDSVWKPFRDKIESKKLEIAWNVPDDSEINSDPVLLRSILTNLVDNAVEYTPRGGAIRLDAEVGRESFTIRISNTVEHLEPADVPRLFERFWRKDLARSDAKHSGLGLSLARAFAHALGADLTASMDGNRRLVLTLRGPALA